MYLNINQLRSFYTAAKMLSITKAAATLSVTPAAVTSQIKQLEEYTGVRLLVRSGNHMSLTDAGSEIYDRIRKVFEELERIEIFMEDIAERKSGVIKIGCSETAAIYVLPLFIKEFKQIYPGINVIIDRGTSSDMIQSLVDRKNELVVARYKPNDGRYKMQYMGQKEIILVAAKESTILPNNKITPQELSEVPLIVPIKGSATREIIRERLKQFGFTPKVILESSSIAFIKTFTQDDEGVSFFCRDVVDDELSQGVLKEVALSGEAMFIEYGIAYLNRRELSRASLALLKMIEKSVDHDDA